MDPFEAFNQSAESNRGNYDPFMAFNKAAGMDQISNAGNQQAERADKNYPIVRVKIPGSRDILTRALQLNETTALPFQIYVKANKLYISPGIVAGFLPSNIFDPIAISEGTDYYIWAECISAGSAITSVTLNHGSSFPTPQTISAGTAPTTLKIPIGMYVKKVSYNLLNANWLTPVPVVAFTITENNGIVTNYYQWSW